MPTDPSFGRLVSLACHDLRTPLATVHGFARTLTRMDGVEEPIARYLGIIEAASNQLAAILDDLTLAARIADGRYDASFRETTTGEVAQAAASSVERGSVTAGGDGAPVWIDVEALVRAVAALARCIVRHGGVEHVVVEAAGAELTLKPVPAAAAPILLGQELRDLGSAVAVRLIEAHGGSVELVGETLRLRLPHEPPT